MGKDDNAKNKFLTGFTLVEILVSIGIMAIIFTIAALNLNARKPGVLVENAAREFLSQLLFAKNLALTGAVFKDEDDPLDGQLDVPFGYGLHFFNDVGNKYFIFGDLYGA
ncbi:MAG: prepilin-type N-terminal cleavage/methylation domain-containing protein, partial [Patescibacteria group bacterium]